MKYLNGLGLAIFSIVLALVGAFFLVNLDDENLNSEAQALIQSPVPVTEQGTNAFYYVVGVRTGATTNPEAAGREWWSQSMTKRPANESDVFNRRLRTDVWPNLPFPVKDMPVASQDWKT